VRSEISILLESNETRAVLHAPEIPASTTQRSTNTSVPEPHQTNLGELTVFTAAQTTNNYVQTLEVFDANELVRQLGALDMSTERLSIVTSLITQPILNQVKIL
jgi:hypothetical protein